MALQEKKATVYDVAKLAGVSYQTVSRVINNNPSVAADTRERVNQAIRTLNFQPNRIAQSLTTGRSRTLQLLNFNSYSPVTVPALVAAEDLGYRMVFSTPNNKDIRNEIAAMSSHQIDGLLLITPYITFTYEELRRLAGNIPFVVIDADIGPEAPCVLIDQHHGMNLIMKHLLELGHRHFAEIIGPEDQYDPRARHETYEEVLASHGIPRGPVAISQFFTPETGYHAAHKILDSGEPFTALVCANDLTAIGAIAALRERGLRVPEDVSVTGFDDDAASAYLHPSLTTISQDFHVLARQSLEHLIAIVNNPATPPYRRVLFPRLIIRESTAPAREI